jgi:hypothetical protein
VRRRWLSAEHPLPGAYLQLSGLMATGLRHDGGGWRNKKMRLKRFRYDVGAADRSFA